LQALIGGEASFADLSAALIEYNKLPANTRDILRGHFNKRQTMAPIRLQTFIPCMMLGLSIWLLSCTRKDIEFGTTPDNPYTSIEYIDTTTVQLSTVMTDSFSTSGTSYFLLGRYRDAYLGLIKARPFFQLAVPASLPEIPSSAIFDSLTLVLRPNDYYYGDSTRSITIRADELSRPMTLSYNNKLYNTSDVPVKAVSLGSSTVRINPVQMDSVVVRLQDAKGQELFTKLRDHATELSSQENFLGYLYGLALDVSAADESFVVGLNAVQSTLSLRVHYHTTVPFPSPAYVDFGVLNNTYTFNQIIAERSGTGLVSTGNNLTEIAASLTGGRVFEQAGTGLNIKITFPYLKNLLAGKSYVRLAKAELIVRPYPQSFVQGTSSLPNQLYMTQTDASNLSSGSVLDSIGSDILYADPVLDLVYGENNYYRFNVTAYISALLTSAGSQDNGFMLMHNASAPLNISRLIVGAGGSLPDAQRCRLRLTLITVNTSTN
jgi:hypothetical protein